MIKGDYQGPQYHPDSKPPPPLSMIFHIKMVLISMIIIIICIFILTIITMITRYRQAQTRP